MNTFVQNARKIMKKKNHNRRRRTKPTDQRKYRNTIGSGRNRIQQICEWNTTIPTGTGTETKAIDDQSCNDVKLADEEFETARGDIR